MSDTISHILRDRSFLNCQAVWPKGSGRPFLVVHPWWSGDPNTISI